MSEKEFDVYLKLIARLLRLSESQRDAIADELRDHMETRLEELMTQGLDRESAIHAAIDEFGDAAGLADQFTTINRQHTLRRRIMKTSIGVLASAAAVALTFLYMLPTNRPGVSGPTQLIAQQADAPTESAGRTARTLDLLSQRIAVDYGDTPLGGVIEHLSDTTGTNIFVNWNLLEVAGCDRDTPVTLALKDTPATTVLSLLFQLLNPTLNEPLDYAVLDDVVVVATMNEINQMRVVRIYDCLDLMQPEPATQAHADPGADTPAATGAEARRNPANYGGGGFGQPGGGYGGEYGGMGGYGAPSQGAGRSTRGGRFTYGDQPGASPQRHASELIQVVHTLLDDGGSVSTYDGMLVVIAGHKTHQRIQETLTLMRTTKQQR